MSGSVPDPGETGPGENGPGDNSSDPTDPVTGRVRITSPLGSAPRHQRRSVAQEIDESTGVGEVYMRSLIRSQLRAALTVVTTIVLSLGALPIVLVTFDATRTTRLFGIPLPWLVLGVVVYPCLLVLGLLYVRQAERAERDFTDLVEGQEGR